MIQKKSNKEAFEYGRNHLASIYNKIEKYYINNQDKIEKLKKKTEVFFFFFKKKKKII